MQSLFTYNNYRELLKDLIYGPEASRGAQSKIAKALECQASYLLQVMKEKASLTEDQGLRLAKHLRYSEIETEYLILILRISRASSPELKTYLESKREALREESLELANKIKSKEVLTSQEFLSGYFGSWMPGTIHAATSSAQYQTITAIAERFGLTPKKVEEVLQLLLNAQLVSKEGTSYKFATDSIFLPRSSALNETHQTNRRLQALKSITAASPDDLHFSSMFTIDKKDLEAVKNIFSDAIEKSHEKIQASGTEEVYSICLDVFKVV